MRRNYLRLPHKRPIPHHERGHLRRDQAPRELNRRTLYLARVQPDTSGDKVED